MDFGQNRTPFDITTVTNSDGSQSTSGMGYLQWATLTVPPDISAYAGGSGSAYAGQGILRAQVNGLALIKGVVGYEPMVMANFGGSFTDNVQLTSTTLPQGAPASYRVTLDVHATQSGAYYYSGFGYPTGTFYLQLAVGTGVGIMYSFPVPGFSDLPDLNFTQTWDIPGLVGDRLAVSSALGLGVQDRANMGYGYQQETHLDASNTVKLFVDPLTPGLGLISESGHDYSSVPEPITALLFVLAAAPVAARKRWRADG
jgi:hypothetical protein